jgi:hypothetical protein
LFWFQGKTAVHANATILSLLFGLAAEAKAVSNFIVAKAPTSFKLA